MAGFEILINNLLSPIVLAFALGMIARLIRSELEFPEPVLKAISVYLLFSIGLKGGHELAQTSFSDIYTVLMVCLFLVLFLPLNSYLICRRLGRFDIPNAAAIAAHYGSVSSVTFFASLSFAQAMNTPAESFMPAVVAVLEWGIVVALLIARWNMGKAEGAVSTGAIVRETLRGRGVVLLSGGLVIGALIGDKDYAQVSPFFDDLFRGVLMLFLLEMGMAAAAQLRDFAKVGRFMIAFGTLAPVLHGFIGVALGTLAGLGVGGAFVLGAIAASSSYIDAPAATRAALPSASPSVYLTSSLGITFPFNLIIGLPLYYQAAIWLDKVI